MPGAATATASGPGIDLPTAWALGRAGWDRWSVYRQAALAGIFVNTFFGIVKLSILFGVADSAGGTVAGYDRASLSTYAWLSQGLIGVVMVFTWTEIADRVKTGDIAVDLARPLDLQLGFLALDLGRATWGLVSRALVPLAFGAIVYGLSVPHDPTAVLLLPVSLVLAVVVSYGGRFLVNLVAFWTTEVRGPVTVYVVVSGLLGGHIIPVQLFPGWLAAIAYATPFPAFMQFPLDLATGQATGVGALWRVAAQVGWAAVLLLGGRVVLARATRRLVVQGG